MFTSHGWKISNTADADYTPEKFEQCGGIGTCEQCTREAENLTNENAAALTAQNFSTLPDPVPAPEPALARTDDETA